MMVKQCWILPSVSHPEDLAIVSGKAKELQLIGREAKMNSKKLIRSLESNGYSVTYFERKASAVDYLNNEIDQKTVGFGDSGTLVEMKLFEILGEHNSVVDPQHCGENESFLEVAKKCLATEVFLTSVNAVSETGELVNIDGTGNRIAGSLFGHKKVYFVIGVNKLTATLEDAIWRAKNIAAPLNARRLGIRTPCAHKGNRCYDCSSPERICNGLMIYYKKMSNIEVEVILVDEALGL